MILCSSPRKNGNTNTVVEWVREGATEAGAAVEVIDVTSLHYQYHGCIACMGCQKSNRFECVVEDEAKPILARIPEAEVLVMATPVYFFGPNAQLKVFCDRMFSLVKIHPETGERIHKFKDRTLGLIDTAGGDLTAGLILIEQTYQTIAKFVDTRFASLLVPLAKQTMGDDKEKATRIW